MPNTPVYNLPYPALTDTPNGPTQIGNLANALDTLFGTFATTDTNLTNRFTNLLLTNAGVGSVATLETRSNNTFGDLATVGPTVTLTSSGTRALCVWGGIVWGNVASAAGRMAIEISNATTMAASAANGIFAGENAGTGVGISGVTARLYTINPGTNQYRIKYNNIAANGTANFQDRWLFVFAP